jgi:signal peptidase I
VTGIVRQLAWLLSGALVGVALLALGVVLVGGRSMEPSLYPGDVCVYGRRVLPAQGDVVLVKQSGQRGVLHRVVRVDERGTCRTKGDANPSEDLRVATTDEIGGTVVFVLPLGRAARGWMQSLRGATLLNQSHSGDDGEPVARDVRRPGSGPETESAAGGQHGRFTPPAAT